LPQRAERRESAPHTEATGASSMGSVAERYAGACRNRVNGICWSYASSRARHPSPQGGGAGSPSHDGTHRAVDADAGGDRGERVRDVRLRGRIRNEHPPTAQVVAARHDGRRSECGGSRP